MKSLLFLLFTTAISLNAACQQADKKNALPDPGKPIQVVEISCGKCKLGLTGKTCETAVRIQGHSYYADGAHIDAFGDAHASDGMCNAIRKAEVQGEVIENRFKISYIKLLPAVKMPR